MTLIGLPVRSPARGCMSTPARTRPLTSSAGVLTFVVGDRRFEASAGELVWLPRQVPHTFANLGNEPVWAFGVTTPAGLEGMFAEQGAYFPAYEERRTQTRSVKPALATACARWDRPSVRNHRRESPRPVARPSRRV